MRWWVLVFLAACNRLPDPPFLPERAVEEVAAILAKQRGLALDPLPDVVVVERAAFAERQELSTEASYEEEAYDALWSALGVVPKGERSKEAYTDVQRRARGLYEPATHKLYYVTDTPRALREPQVAHVLLHALQKQHGMLYKVPDDEQVRGYVDDVSWAWACAREGEAILYELAWPRGRIEDARAKLPGLAERIDTAGKPYAVRWAYFPYFAGARYALARAKGTLRETCTALHKRPPMSTEQVLHPERRDPPVAVIAPDLSDTLGGDWELEQQAVLGEWTVADWLKTAEGLGGGLPDELRWGGDLAQIYADPENYLVVVWTWWDDDASARAFHARVGDALRLGRLVGVAFGPRGKELLRAGISRVRTAPFESVRQLRHALARR